MASSEGCNDGTTTSDSSADCFGSSGGLMEESITTRGFVSDVEFTKSSTAGSKQECGPHSKRRRPTPHDGRLQRKDSQRLLNRLDGKTDNDDDAAVEARLYRGKEGEGKEEPSTAELLKPTKRRCRSTDFTELLTGVADDDENDGDDANATGRVRRRQSAGEEDGLDDNDALLTSDSARSALTYSQQGDRSSHSPRTRRRRLHLAAVGEDDAQTITTIASTATTTTSVTVPTTPPQPPGTAGILRSSLSTPRLAQRSPRQRLVPTPGMTSLAVTEKDRIMAALEARDAASAARQRRREQDSGAAVADISPTDQQHDGRGDDINDTEEESTAQLQAPGESAMQPMNMNLAMPQGEEASVHDDENIVENDRWEGLEMVRGQWGRSDRTLFTVTTSATLVTSTAGAESTASSSGTRPVRATRPGAVQMTGRAYGLVRPAWYLGHGRAGGNSRAVARDRRRSRSRSCSRPTRRRSRHHRPSCGTNGSGSPLDEEGAAIRRSSGSSTSSFGGAAATVQWFTRGSGGREWTVEATRVDEDDRGADCCVAYVNAETMPSTMKLIWSDRPWTLCLGAVAIGVVGAILAVGLTLFVQSLTGGGIQGGSDANEKVLAPSTSPTIAPTTSSAPTLDINYLRDALSQVTHPADLANPETPQHRALWWFAEEDAKAQPDRTSLYQRYAMTVLYFSTGGPDSWIRRGQWLNTSLNECSWDYSTIKCEQFGGRSNIVELDLSKKGLVGTLPSEIQLLRSLETLVLNSNLLRGTLPTEIGLLRNLGMLEVEKNALHGTVPSTISKLKTLDDLDMSDNLFSGTIPLGIFSLSELRSLDMSNNGFNGTISNALESLRMLNTFDASSNELTGTLPTALARMPNLASLRLDNNLISGRIPNILRSVGQRKEFSCANNRLNGTFNAVDDADEEFINIFRNIRLEKLDLSGNELSGNITAALVLFLRIEDLDLSDNMLSGSIPSFGELHLPELEYFDLSKNLLTGNFPSVSAAPKLKFCDLRSNNFDGVLSDTWDEAPLLQHLDFGLNVIRSEIPPQLGNLTSLEFLGLRNCKLSGSIPSTLGNLQRLKFLDLGMNMLSRVLPRELTSLKFLEILNVARNRLSGSILPEIASLESLRILSLRANVFNGLIPPEIGRITTLEQLHLEENELTGTVPASICSLKNSMSSSFTEFTLDRNEVSCDCCD